MPEIIWKQGAENDLLQIFAELEQRSEEAGMRFVGKLQAFFARARILPVISRYAESGQMSRSADQEI
jgi:plasmid stabilization system protein ParE